jgi:hypothetical protein
MDRPEYTTSSAWQWIEYADALEQRLERAAGDVKWNTEQYADCADKLKKVRAENAILQNNNEALNKDDKTLKDHIELLESDLDKLEARCIPIEVAAQAMIDGMKPSYTTAKNSSAVRKGFAVSGSIRHYECQPHQIHALMNTLEVGDD